jgi:hypothetical protein
VGCIIGTNVAPPEPRSDVELNPATEFFIGDSSEARFSGARRADSGGGELTTTFTSLM